MITKFVRTRVMLMLTPVVLFTWDDNFWLLDIGWLQWGVALKWKRKEK